jgi:hypothetical protein
MITALTQPTDTKKQDIRILTVSVLLVFKEVFEWVGTTAMAAHAEV